MKRIVRKRRAEIGSKLGLARHIAGTRVIVPNPKQQSRPHHGEILTPETSHKASAFCACPASTEQKSDQGMMLAALRPMKFFCRHCEKIRRGHRYRVFSEEDGEILLDMTVCFSCFHQARELGLRAEPIVSKAQPSPQRSEDHRDHRARH